MSTVTKFGYDYVLELVSQLSIAEQERLVQDMSEPRKKHNTEGKPFKMVEYTVPGTPIISPETMEEINSRVKDRVPLNTPEEKEKNRQELLKILLNCPIMTDEELKGFEEARREINECRLTYL